MSNKLIGLSQLQEFKTKSDLKYQDKLTAGSNISISNNVISCSSSSASISSPVSPTQRLLTNNTIMQLGNITLPKGKYMITYTCTFATNNKGYRQIGFSTNTTDITGFGRAWGDNQNALSNIETQACVSGTFQVTNSNGQKFYFLAKQTSGGSLKAYPSCSYIKF